MVELTLPVPIHHAKVTALNMLVRTIPYAVRSFSSPSVYVRAMLNSVLFFHISIPGIADSFL